MNRDLGKWYDVKLQLINYGNTRRRGEEGRKKNI